MIRSFVTQKRLYTYPRLIVFVYVLVFLWNVLLGENWMGASGKIIGCDFLVLYASGLLFLRAPETLYDYSAQLELQRQLVSPTVLEGTGLYSNPPHVAAFYSLFSPLSLEIAFGLWLLILTIATVLGARICYRYLWPQDFENPHLSLPTSVFLVLASFPFFEGFFAGQNHGVSFFFVSIFCAAFLNGWWIAAGLSLSCLLYKPQLVLGFLVVLLLRKRFREVAVFLVGALAQLSTVFLVAGPELYLKFLENMKDVLLLPYMSGWPGYLLLTPYGFLTSWFGEEYVPTLQLVTYLLAALGLANLIFLTLQGVKERVLLGVAVLFPFVASPYLLFHDWVILIPMFCLLMDRQNAQLLGATFFWSFTLSIPILLLSVVTDKAFCFLLTIICVAPLWALYFKKSSEPDKTLSG